LLEKSYYFGFASRALEAKAFKIRIAIALLRGARFKGDGRLGHHVEVENVDEGGVIGGLVLDFESSAQVGRSAKKDQLST